MGFKKIRVCGKDSIHFYKEFNNVASKPGGLRGEKMRLVS